MPTVSEMPRSANITVEEAANILCLSRSMIYKLMDTGVLENLRIGKARRIPRAAVEKLLAQSAVPAQKTQPRK